MSRAVRGLRLALAGALLLGLALPSAGVHAHLAPSHAHDCEIASHAGAGHLGSDGGGTGAHPPGCIACRLAAKPRAAVSAQGAEARHAAGASPRSLAATPRAGATAPDVAALSPRAPPALPSA